jgi:hypothetical protein
MDFSYFGLSLCEVSLSSNSSCLDFECCWESIGLMGSRISISNGLFHLASFLDNSNHSLSVPESEIFGSKIWRAHKGVLDGSVRSSRWTSWAVHPT